MRAVLQSALFEEAGPAELAGLAGELGFEGLDLAVHGHSTAEAERLLAGFAGSGVPARLLSLDSASLSELPAWLELAAACGLEAVRLAPPNLEPRQLAELLGRAFEATPNAATLVLVPHHPGSPLADLPTLDALITSCGERAAALLAPDLVPRSRAGDHAAWLARLPLPRLGAVQVAGYRWDSEIGSGNLRLWSPRAAHVLHGLTPWTEWLHRIATTGFDGLFTFGDASLTGTLADRLRTVRDDLRVVRRLWPRGNEPDATST